MLSVTGRAPCVQSVKFQDFNSPYIKHKHEIYYRINNRQNKTGAKTLQCQPERSLNMIYSIAMRSLVQHASDLSLVMTLQQSSRQFWSDSKCPPMHEPNYIQASDVEFVDDAALRLSARSPS